MNLVSIKKTDDMKLKGITIDAEWRDKALAALTLTDEDGNMVRLVTEHYQVRAFVQAPPEKKTKHVLSGTVPTLATPIREEFDDPSTATNRKYELESAGVIADPVISVEEVDIPF